MNPHELSSSSTDEIGNIVPVLRDDLQFSLQRHGAEDCYVIEDSATSKYFCIGLPEYIFISLLDGTTSVNEAVAYTATTLGPDAFTTNQAAAICKWLVDTGLGYTAASQRTDRLVDVAQKSEEQRHAEWLNPLIFKMPLLQPDQLLTSLTGKLGWMVGWPSFLVWLAVIFTACQHVFTNWTALTSNANGIFAPGNRIALVVCWILLKVVHELAHGVVCKKFGGHVREAGLLFIVLAPIPYVDVTSSWRFSSKWQRIMTGAAGMYIELFCGAVAAIAWCHTQPSLAHQVAYNVMITATLTTILFNANALMRFDGYYILSDFLEIPNLYSLGQAYTRSLGRRYYFGLPTTLPAWTSRNSWIIKSYGLLSFLWRFLVCGSLVITAATLFAGAGIVLAILGLAMWIGVPAIKLIRTLADRSGPEQPNQLQFAVSLTTTIMAFLLVWMLPQPGGVRVPAVVAYDPLHIIRAPYSGFVDEIHVEPGQQVNQGDVVAVMRNPQLESEAADLQLAISQSELRRRVFREQNDIAAAQAEAEDQTAYRLELDERQRQLARSRIVAPADGTVLARDLNSKLGTFLEEGQELLAVGDRQSKRLEIAIPQENIEIFTAQVGAQLEVLVRSPGIPPQGSRLESVDSQGSRNVRHEALSAIYGGPLTVRPILQTADSPSQEEWELLEPMFHGLAPLTQAQSTNLRAGQITTVRLSASRGTLGQYVSRSIRNWVAGRLKQAGVTQLY